MFIGAGVGGGARYVFGGLIQQVAGAAFPWATLVINATGSLVIGFLYAFMDEAGGSPQLRLLLGVGFCGGYTTFSTFSYETVRLLQDSDFGRAGAYIVMSVALSLVCTIVGFRAAAMLLGRI